MNRQWIHARSTLLLLASAALFTCENIVVAQEAISENVWISSVEWIGNDELLATQSQGLLLRPGKLVKLSASEPQKLEMLGESETSLWSAVDLHGSVLTSDYKGRLIRFEGGQPNPIELNARWMRCLAKAPGTSKEIVAGTEDGQLIVVNQESWSEVRRVKVEPTAAVFQIAFNAQQTQVAVAMGDGNVHLLAWPGLESQKILKGNGATWSCIYSIDGTQLITGGADRKVHLWDIASGTRVVALTSTRDWITSMHLLPNTSCVVATCMNGEVVLVDYVTKLPVRTMKAANSGIWDLALSPDGKRIALGTRKHGVQIVDCSGWYDEVKEAAQISANDKAPEPK